MTSKDHSRWTQNGQQGFRTQQHLLQTHVFIFCRSGRFVSWAGDLVAADMAHRVTHHGLHCIGSDESICRPPDSGEGSFAVPSSLVPTWATDWKWDRLTQTLTFCCTGVPCVWSEQCQLKLVCINGVYSWQATDHINHEAIRGNSNESESESESESEDEALIQIVLGTVLGVGLLVLLAAIMELF